MKVIIAGYDKGLSALVNGVLDKGHTIVGVMRIDRVKYNGFTLFLKDIFAPSKDYSYIKSKNLKEIKTNSVNSKKFRDFVLESKAQVILVGSWSEKFSIETIELTKYGTINFHPSLLPLHRGANPYFWQIYANDKKAGVTFHYMTEKLDAGEILMQASFDITPYMTGGLLKTKTCKVAEIMVGELLDDLENNTIIPIEQDELKSTYDRWENDLRIIDLNLETPFDLHNKIRGLRPFCHPIINFENKIYKIKYSELIKEQNPNISNFTVQKENKTIYARYKECTLKIVLF